ncbi:DUF2249 domain-containing protein [Demequina aurantiaca]|uniref:DUF2249 domain-containing protein n=1 Tax=Demequina aurantiaca TaxID=676200 RepID=UPI000783D55E|nr:DUF2249 domain-containing protein [Demequina aurantiaca]
MTETQKTQATQAGTGCACGGDGGCSGDAKATAPQVIGIEEVTAPAPSAPAATEAHEGDLDVRTIDHSARHARVIGVVTSLVPGESMVIAADHAPLGVLREIDAEVQGDFRFEYLAEGPSLWRVQVERVTCC